MANNTLMWFEIQLAPLHDVNGQVTHLTASGMDVSQRYHAQEMLCAKEEHYRSLFESMDQGYGVVELMYGEQGQVLDYRFLETNPAFQKHPGLVAATGQHMRELVPNIEEKWFDVCAFRLGGKESRKIGILFSDAYTPISPDAGVMKKRCVSLPRNCQRLITGKISFSQPWRTSCATRLHRSATACSS